MPDAYDRLVQLAVLSLHCLAPPLYVYCFFHDKGIDVLK